MSLDEKVELCELRASCSPANVSTSWLSTHVRTVMANAEGTALLGFGRSVDRFGRSVDRFGRSVDRFERPNGEWRIAHRQVIIDVPRAGNGHLRVRARLSRPARPLLPPVTLRPQGAEVVVAGVGSIGCLRHSEETVATLAERALADAGLVRTDIDALRSDPLAAWSGLRRPCPLVAAGGRLCRPDLGALPPPLPRRLRRPPPLRRSPRPADRRPAAPETSAQRARATHRDGSAASHRALARWRLHDCLRAGGGA